MTVVRNEMEMGENNPGARAVRADDGRDVPLAQLRQDARSARAADVENVDIPRLQAFYRKYYQPDNATLIVSGKFDAGATCSSSWPSTFGKLAEARRASCRCCTRSIRRRTASAASTLRRVGGAPLLLAGYHVPAGPRPGLSPRSRCSRWCSATRRRDACTSALVETAAGRGHLRRSRGRWPSPARAVRRAAGAGAGRREGARRAAARVDESLAARADHAPRSCERAKAQVAQRLGAVSSPTPRRSASRCRRSVGAGRLAPVLPAARPRARQSTLADVQRRRRRSTAADATARSAPTCRPTRRSARRLRRRSTWPQHDEGLQAASRGRRRSRPSTRRRPTSTRERSASTIGGIKAALLPKGTRGGAVHAVLTLRFGDEKSLFGTGEVPDTVAGAARQGHDER